YSLRRPKRPIVTSIPSRVRLPRDSLMADVWRFFGAWNLEFGTFQNIIPPVNLTHWQWTLLAAGAFLVGMSKTGFAGLGVLGVALFAIILPARESTGTLVPLLVCADFFGVAI